MKAEEFVTALKQKPKCVSSEAMFTDQMRVAFPNEPNERRLLVALYRVGIVSAIKNAPAIDDAFRLKFKKMIVATYRIADEAVMAAVDLWCDGYGRGILQKGIVKEYSAAVVRQPAPTSSNAGSGFLLRCHCFCVWEFRRIRHGSCPTTLLTHVETQNRAYRFCCPKRRVSLHRACGRVRGKARFDPHRENRPARRGNMEGCTRRRH